MSVATELVSWNEAEIIGPIKGAEWVWPGDWKALAALAHDQIEITDAVILEQAKGQRRHLEGMHYPEGYDAVRVMSEDGLPVLDSDSLQNYGGLSRARSGRPPMPVRGWVLLRDDVVLPVGDNRRLKALNGTHGPESIITPLIPQAYFRHADGTAMTRVPMTRAAISPESKSLSIEAYAQAANTENGLWTNLKIETLDDKSRQAMALLTVRTLDGESSLRLEINDAGKTVAVRPFGPSILNILGISDPKLREVAEQNRGSLQGASCSVAAEAVITAIGYPNAGPLDLRSTAMAVYRDMGQPGFSPETVLAFR